jgi:hypothetical protein
MKLGQGLTLVAVSLVACSSIGCAGKYTGGGWIDSPGNPGKKANFGVNLHAEDKNGDGEVDSVKGQLQYVDHGNGMTLHGVVDDGYIIDQDGDPATPDIGQLFGTYTPKPNGEPGYFDLWVYDGGDPGPSDGDWFDLILIGGEYDGYYTFGAPVQGGNIKYHPPE